jgi:hypothetical protein
MTCSEWNLDGNYHSGDDHRCLEAAVAACLAAAVASGVGNK